MEKKHYDYNEWLSTHTKSKTMMEKLERSLVPYDLFAAIGMKNDKQERTGDVTIGDNTYHYHIKYDYRCIGHDVYDAELNATDIRNKWHNLLMGYNKFKVVMDHQSIKTIYSDHEDFFQRIIEMFENDDWGALYQNRCAYVNNLLARYILLCLLEKYRPELQRLTTIDTKEDGKVFVMAASSNRTEMVMYAFSKREAMDMAQQFDGISKKLTIVYFFNQDFERDGNIRGFDSGCTKVVSARSFYMSLTDNTIERRIIERRMLLLVSLMYNEHLEWHFDRIDRVVADPPFYGKHMAEQKKKLKGMKNKASKARKRLENQGQPWWEKIPRTLLEDALNVLGDEPKTHADIFHFLCAANMVNAYVNQCKQKDKYSDRNMQRMYQAKSQIFKCIIALAEQHNPNVHISVSALPAVLTSIAIEGRKYQLSFRGMTDQVLDALLNAGVDSHGKFDGCFLQPIATALYQYSYMLRWKGIQG